MTNLYDLLRGVQYFSIAAPEPAHDRCLRKDFDPRMFEVWVGGNRQPHLLWSILPHFYVPTCGTEWNPCGVTFLPLALSCQVAASSHVFCVLVGCIVLPRSLGTRLGSAQVPPGQLPASVVDEFAAAQ